MERVIGGKYKLGRKIGGGSFGEIYLGACVYVYVCSPPLSFGINAFVFITFSAATHVDSFEIVAVKIVSVSRFGSVPFASSFVADDLFLVFLAGE